MFTNKSISRMFSVLLIVMFLLTGILPMQAESLASPLYTSGDLLWAKSMGGTRDDFSDSIAVDSSGNIYTTGSFEGTADFDPGAGTFNLTGAGGGDIFVSKLDSSGNFVWAKRMGGTDYENGYSIAVDSSGNIYTTGSFEGTADFDSGAGISNLTSAGLPDIFVSKLDSSGNFVWAKNMGGTDWDFGLGIAVDSSGNIYTTGSFEGTADFDPGPGTSNLTGAGLPDIFVSKLDSSGNFVWAKSIGAASFDTGIGIALDSSGNIYTTGSFEGTADFDPGAGTSNLTSAGSSDMFVSKLDSSGNFVWAKRMGGTSDDYGYGIVLDTSGNIYTTGSFSGTADFDPGAGASNLTSEGLTNIFVSKLDSSGNFVWAKSMGGTDYDDGLGIAVDSSRNVYTTGSFEGTADFDPGAGTSNLTSAGLPDIFVSKLDSSGNFVWAKSMGAASYDYGFGIVLDSSGNVYMSGSFEGTADFDPGPGTSNLTSAGSNDIFVSKLEASSNQVIQVSIDIKPGSLSNPINPKSLGTIPIAILSTPDFDASLEVDKTSLTFGRTGDEHSLVFCNKNGEDVNDDGLLDLVCHFKTKLTGFQIGDTVGTLKGQTVNGVPIEGQDTVRILK